MTENRQIIQMGPEPFCPCAIAPSWRLHDCRRQALARPELIVEIDAIAAA